MWFWLAKGVPPLQWTARLTLATAMILLLAPTLQTVAVALVLFLAHIGILKAIDSAGLKIDYITGTSMGSVIGGLYAIGYSADTIEKIARTIDWDIMLSNQSSLRSVFMAEKEEYGKYVLELPWVNHKFRLPTGILEGQELWLKFSELFFPVS